MSWAVIQLESTGSNEMNENAFGSSQTLIWWLTKRQLPEFRKRKIQTAEKKIKMKPMIKQTAVSLGSSH